MPSGTTGKVITVAQHKGGAGKTTLTEMLSKHYKWIPNFEDVDHNPYLMDFYEDMPRWSCNLQIFFLNSRLHHLVEIL